MNVRLINFIIFIVIVVLEIIGLYCIIYAVYNSHCILGGEYSISIWSLMYLMPPIFLHTVSVLVFAMFFYSIGLDPYILFFCFVSGIAMFICGFVLFIAMISHCGNEFAPYFYIAAAMALFGGILLIVNAVGTAIYYERDFVESEDSLSTINSDFSY